MDEAQITVTILKSLLEKLNRICEAQGKSQSEVIEELIDEADE